MIQRATPQWFIPMDQPQASLETPVAVVDLAPAGDLAGFTPVLGHGAGQRPDPARARARRDRADALGARAQQEPHPVDGRGTARLGDQPPARLGRADRALRQPRDAASICATPRSTTASSRRSRRAARMRGSPRTTRRCSGRTISSPITSRRKARSRSNSPGRRAPPDAPPRRFFAKPRPFLPGDFVTTDQGTGLVHMAPDHGEDDFLLCKHTASTRCSRSTGGLLSPRLGVARRAGERHQQEVRRPDGPICSDLRAAGALLAASDDFAHSYPHSWRSKAKVIQRATPQWFIPMDQTQDVARLRSPVVDDSRLAGRPRRLLPGRSATRRATARRSRETRARRDRADALGARAQHRTASARWSRGAPTG